MRLEKRVRAAISSMRAPASPLSANSSVAISTMFCLTPSGSWLRAGLLLAFAVLRFSATAMSPPPVGRAIDTKLTSSYIVPARLIITGSSGTKTRAAARSLGRLARLPNAAKAVIDEIGTRHRASAVDARAVLIGLVGRGIASSRSPAMHQREAERLGMRCTYALIDFDRFDLADTALGDVMAAAEANGFAAVNVTHPFKQTVIPYLTDLAPEAAAIGAVNTVVFDAARRIGHNTDCWGFAESFRRDMAGCGLKGVLQ